MYIKKTILLCLIVTVTVIICSAQTKVIDSLKREIVLAPVAQRQAAIFNLCEQGYNMHPDTLLAYAAIAKQVAVKEHNMSHVVRAMYHQCVAYTTKGLIDSSLKIASQCREILSGKVNDPLLLANVFNQIGRCNMRRSEYKEAIEMGYKIVSAAEKTQDVLIQVKGKTLIGWAYLEMAQYGNALSWHLKALHTSNDTILLEKYGIIFANLALNYINLGITDSAFYYIKKAIECSRKYENLFALSNSLAIQSQLYIRAGTPSLAETSLKEVVAIRKLIGDPFYIVSDMSQLGLYYAHYGAPENGIKICNEGIEIARQYHLDSKLIFLYSSLGENYKVKGDLDMYAHVLKKIISLKDTVFKKNSAQALAEIQAKFELQKKENFIIQQNLKISRQHYFFYGLLIFALFSIVVTWFVFRGYKKRQQIKLQQMQEEEKQQSMIEVIKAREAERKRIAADLHDNLGAYAASIASNLDNITPDKNDQSDQIVLQELRNNSRAIVSQLIDTIWVLKKDNLSLTAISDRVKVFIQRIRPGYPEANIDVFENISTDILMPASRAFHLFRIIQEALMNALKNNHAKNIRVYVESGDNWKISISDDGNGVKEMKDIFYTDNGVSNMRARSREAGFKIEWLQNEQVGTNVVIDPTTN